MPQPHTSVSSKPLDNSTIPAEPAKPEPTSIVSPLPDDSLISSPQEKMDLPDSATDNSSEIGTSAPSNNNCSGASRANPFFICPLSKKIFQDPVVASDGVTYERSAYLESRKKKADDDGNEVVPTKLYPNRALQEIMLDSIEKRQEFATRISSSRVSEGNDIDESPPTDDTPSTIYNNDYGLPESYYCPITCELMKYPVIDFEGNTYEKQAIKMWIRRNRGTSPLTRNKISTSKLYPNRILTDLLHQEAIKCQTISAIVDVNDTETSGALRKWWVEKKFEDELKQRRSNDSSSFSGIDSDDDKDNDDDNDDDEESQLPNIRQLQRQSAQRNIHDDSDNVGNSTSSADNYINQRNNAIREEQFRKWFTLGVLIGILLIVIVLPPAYTNIAILLFFVGFFGQLISIRNQQTDNSPGNAWTM